MVSRHYERVLPRDLFNEAKLLKCLGQVSLLLHDERHPPLIKSLELRHTPFGAYRGFAIKQDPGDGSIYVSNLQIRVGGKPYRLSTALNSKDPYPLYLQDPKPPSLDEEVEIAVLTDEGKFTTDFLTWLTKRGVLAIEV